MGCFSSKPVVAIRVKDRKSGHLLEESVPYYLRTLYKSMYENRCGRLSIRSGCVKSALEAATNKYGVKMNHPSSVSAIPEFIRMHNINLDDVKLNLSEFKTFNDFFIRELKPSARKYDNEHDRAVLVAPADCRIVVFQSLAESTALWIKGSKFTVENLLGPLAGGAAKHFQEASVAVCRLAVQDYHRWHMPFDARIERQEMVDGAYYSVNPRAINNYDVLTSNKRYVALLHSSTFGKVAMVSVGAALVSSITVFSQEGDECKKGQMHGHFSFGGSTVILLFEKHAVEFDKDLLQNSREPIETYVQLGNRIGVVAKKDQHH